MSNYVFVYGTLRCGGGNHARLLARLPVATIIAELPYRMVSLGGFPGLVPSDHAAMHQITGELYEVTKEEFASLDRLEGYPTFYNRIQFPLQEFGIDNSAWVYVLKPEDGEGCIDVTGGDWMEWKHGIVYNMTNEEN